MFSYSENLSLSLKVFINIEGRNSDLTGEKPGRQRLNKARRISIPNNKTCQHCIYPSRMHRRVHHFRDLTQNLNLNLILRKYQEHPELRDRIQITVQHLFMKGKERLRNPHRLGETEEM